MAHKQNVFVDNEVMTMNIELSKPKIILWQMTTIELDEIAKMTEQQAWERVNHLPCYQHPLDAIGYSGVERRKMAY